MSSDLTISPVLSASSFAKLTPLGASAEAGDAFGQMLLGVQNAAAGVDPAAALMALAGGGIAGRGLAGGGLAGGGTVAQQVAPSDGLAPAVGHAGDQVTNFGAVAAAGAALKALGPGVVAADKGALDQVKLAEPIAVGGHVDATSVAAGIVAAPQAAVGNAPQVVAAAVTSRAAMALSMADEPAVVPVADGVSGRPVVGSPVADAQPSGLKHVKAVVGRDGAGGSLAAVPLAAAVPTAAVPLAAAVPTAAVPLAEVTTMMVAVPGPQGAGLSMDDNSHGPVQASASGGHATAPAVGSDADKLLRAVEVTGGGSGQGTGLIDGARTSGSGPEAAALAAGTGAAGVVQGLSAGAARDAPSAAGGRGAVGVSSGAFGLPQRAPLGSAEPAGGGVAGGAEPAGRGVAGGAGAGATGAVSGASVRTVGPVTPAPVSGPGGAISPAVTPAPARQFGGDASVGAMPAAIPAGAGNIAVAGAGGVQAGSSGSAGADSAWQIDRGVPAGVVAGGSPGATGPVPTVGSGVVTDVSAGRAGAGAAAGGAARVADASLWVGGSGRDAPAVTPGPRDLNMGVGVAAPVTAVAAPAAKPVQAAPTHAAGLAPATSLDSMGRPGVGAAVPVEAAISVAAVAAPGVTVRAAGVVRAASSNAASRPAAVGGAAPVEAAVLGVAAPSLVKASEVASGAPPSRAGLPASSASMGAMPTVEVAVSPRAEPVRAVATGPVQTVAAPVSAPVPEVAAPVLAAPVLAAAVLAAAGAADVARPAAGSLAHAPMAADAPVPAPADVAAQNFPVPSAVSVMPPVAVEDFGAASGVVPQASGSQGVAGAASMSGRAGEPAASGARVVPRAATPDRQMQWLPAIDGTGAVSLRSNATATATATATAGAAAGGGSVAVSASGTAAAAGPMLPSVQVAGVPAAMSAPGQSAEPMPADARAAGTPVADHKIVPHAADAQSDPVPAAVSVASPEQAVQSSAPSAPSVDAPAAAAAQAPSPVRVPEPAEQVGSALLTLAKTPEGAQETTVRMQPAELGMVQVRITRMGSGATQIDITAEKTSTLLALQRDQPQLHRTLDEAGISAIGRSITIHAAPAAQVASIDGAPSLGGGHPGGQQGSGQQGQGGRGNTGSADADAGGGGDRGGFPGRDANSYGSGRRPGVASELVAANGNIGSRAALDITA